MVTRLQPDLDKLARFAGVATKSQRNESESSLICFCLLSSIGTERAESVLEFKSMGMIDGKIVHGYGRRWLQKVSSLPLRGFWRDCKGYFYRGHVLRSTEDAYIYTII